VQETWLRLSRSDASEIENLGGWLTTVVGRVCLNMPRSRKSRREEPLEPHMPDPIVSREDGTDPEYEALQADSVGLALLVVLDTLAPGERLAFVLHDLFGVPFDEIARIVDRSPTGARQLASRARRRVQGPRRSRTPISPASERWSTPSSPPLATATSRRSWRCSTRTSSCEPTAVGRARPSRRWFTARGRSPSGHSCSRTSPRSCDRRS
jgi:RNA polymerase sigma factor (sigma-70 family)